MKKNIALLAIIISMTFPASAVFADSIDNLFPDENIPTLDEIFKTQEKVIQKVQSNNQEKKNSQKENQEKKSETKLPETKAQSTVISKEIKSSFKEVKHSDNPGVVYGTKDIDILAKTYLGSKYIWGGVGPEGYDCSGFVVSVYDKLGISLPRTTYDQVNCGSEIARENLVKGDLIFFDTRTPQEASPESEINKTPTEKESEINLVLEPEKEKEEQKEIKEIKIKPSVATHVGIYIGDGNFIHASSSKGEIIVSQLSSSYYSERYLVARRFF